MKKFGVILAPTTQLTGALELNRDIYAYLKKELDVTAIIPDTDYYYTLPIVGYILNYFTNYDKSNGYDWVMGTSIATLPFINKANVIQHFHGVDTAGFKNVLGSISGQNQKENDIMNKWLEKFGEYIEEDIEAVKIRLEISKATEGICAEKSKKIMVVAPLVKRHLVDLFNIDENKIDVILNGIPDYWFENDSDFISEPEVVYTTRANSSGYTMLEKGHDRGYEILSALNCRKNVYIYFSQLNNESAQLYKETLSKNTRAEIISGLGRREIKKKYRAGQIYLATSRTEACQLTLIEAMASMLVPVTYPVGIVDDYITNGENGFVINSVEEGIETIKMLADDNELRKKIAKNAYITARENFGYENMLNSYLENIVKIIK